MAGDVVDLAARRPPPHEVIVEGSPILDGLMHQVAHSSDPVIAALWLTSIFSKVAVEWGVPLADVVALAAGEVQLDTLARRHAGLLARWAEEELARQNGDDAHRPAG